MRKRHRYPLGRLRHDYSYTIPEICKLYKIHPNTVTRWIQDGLPIIPATRPYLIFSKALKEFLAGRQKTRKHTIGPKQMYCVKCRKPTESSLAKLQVFAAGKRAKRMQSSCLVCGSLVNKFVAASQWNAQHPLYLPLHDGPSQSNGMPSCSPACQIQPEL